jgi:hypothetical protein
MPKINPYLTPGTHRVLTWMREQEEQNTGEQLTCAVPGGWWIGCDQVSGAVGQRLLKLVAIRLDCGEPMGDYRLYTLTEYGKKMLDDINYVPEVVVALERRIKNEPWAIIVLNDLRREKPKRSRRNP